MLDVKKCAYIIGEKYGVFPKKYKVVSSGIIFQCTTNAQFDCSFFLYSNEGKIIPTNPLLINENLNGMKRI